MDMGQLVNNNFKVIIKNIDMFDETKALIDEHKDLVTKINTLESTLCVKKEDIVDIIDFANKCVQLKAMKVYADALKARLVNRKIYIENDVYLLDVTKDEGDTFDKD